MNIAQKHTTVQANAGVSSVISLWPDVETVTFTVLTSQIPDHAMTKRFVVGSDGAPSKQKDSRSGTVPTNSLAERVEINGSAGDIMRAFGDRIASLKQQQVLILAPHVGAEAVVPCVQQWDLKNRPDAIAKKKECFPVPAGPAIMGLDFDVGTWPSPLVEKVCSHENLLEGPLAEVFSAFGTSAFTIRPSASAFVTNVANGKGTGHPSYHAYYPVKSGADVAGDNGASFAQRLHERLVLAGYGFGFVAKTGHVFIRSLIDTSATSDYSRFWYEADAIFADDRLAYKEPRRVILKQEHGGFLDTSLLSPLTDDERQQFDKICLDLQHAIQPEADKARQLYLAKRKADLVKRGKSPEHADKILKLAVERQILAADFEVAQNDGPVVTVAEILADPERYDGMQCPDPFEPDYGNGRSHAMIMLSGTFPHINSFAHGGRVFELERGYTQYFEEIDDAPAGEHLSPNRSSIVVVRGRIDPATVEVREYVIEPRLPRRDVYQLVGEPGAGKSQAILRDAMIVATGDERILRGEGNISNERLHLSGPVIVYNAEDRIEEMQRRLIALQKHYAVASEDMKHPIILWSGVEDTLTVMSKPGRGAISQAPGSRKLRALIKEHNAVLVALDPQISLAAGVDENSNDDMNALLQELANIASETNCCIQVVHHTSKQKRQSAGDMGAGRGAFAAVGKVRAAYTLTNVLGDEDEAKSLGIAPEDAIVMLMNAKLSHSEKRPPTFFRKVSVCVGNGKGVRLSRPFDGAELSPRERLLLEGDQAPVLVIVDVSKLAAKAGAAKTTVSEQAATSIAQIVDAVMGDLDRCELNGVWNVIGAKLREIGLTTAKARHVLTSVIVDPLLGNGRQIERNGQIVRLRAAKKSEGTTSPWVLFREYPDKLSEGM